MNSIRKSKILKSFQSLSLLAALCFPVVGASEKVVSNGQTTPSGVAVNIGQYSDIVLTSNGKAVIMSGGGDAVFSAFPGGLSAIVKNGSSTSDGLILSDVNDDSEVTAISQNGDFAFFSKIETKSGQKQPSGLFLMSKGKVVEIARQGGIAPGGGKYDMGDGIPRGATTVRISNNGRYVAFRTLLTGGGGDGLYLADASYSPVKVVKIALVGTPAPIGGKFTDFGGYTGGSLAVTNSGGIVFSASTELNYGGYNNPLFAWNGSSIISIADTEGAYRFKSNDRGDLLVMNNKGLLFGTIDGVNVAIEKGSPAPGGGTFNYFEYPLLDSSGNVAFSGQISGGPAEDGIFLRTADGVKKIMLTSDSPPGGGLFSKPYSHESYPLAIDGGSVYFQAKTSGGPGVFAGNGIGLSKVIRKGDTLNGKTVTNVAGFFNERQSACQDASNQSGQILYWAQFGFESGLFIHPFVPTPEIEVRANGSNLADEKGSVSFGAAVAGAAGKTVTFTVKNVGNSKLKNLAVSISGRNAPDFKLIPFKSTSLASGSKITFEVSFRPAKKGIKKAVIKVRSNDKDENPFDITIKGSSAL